MRRDVLRVGIGRLLLEGALGVVLLLPTLEPVRLLAMTAAVLMALVAHFAPPRRRAFVAAHFALCAAALFVRVSTPYAPVVLAAGLGGAIELTHVDLVERRRLTEHWRSLRVPSSLLVRRLGTVVVVAAIGRAMRPIATMTPHPMMLAPLMIGIGAFALLAAGFGAGPGRPVARPIDAAVFLGLAILVVIPTS